jgi:hypothetical protein
MKSPSPLARDWGKLLGGCFWRQVPSKLTPGSEYSLRSEPADRQSALPYEILNLRERLADFIGNFLRPPANVIAGGELLRFGGVF